MKNSFLLTVFAISLFVFISCKESLKNQPASTEQSIIADSAVSDGHNSANSLDFAGTYTGILPCADCEGIKTEIILNKDLTYEIRKSYLGKDEKIFEITGSFAWNAEGNTIIFSGIKDAPNQYFVSEDKVIQLDMEGRRITGNLADKYVLVK